MFNFELTLIECVNKSVNKLNFVLYLFSRWNLQHEMVEVTANICEPSDGERHTIPRIPRNDIQESLFIF